MPTTPVLPGVRSALSTLAEASPAPAVSADSLGSVMACLVLLIGLLLSIRKLLGWDKEGKQVAATKAELDTIVEKIGDSATKAEVNAMREEMARQYSKLEDYTHRRAHDTLNAVNNVHLNMERLRVELMKEVVSNNDRLRTDLARELAEHTRRIEDRVTKSADILQGAYALLEELKRERKQND